MVTERSAEPTPTVVVAVPVSLPAFGSVVVDAPVAVFVMIVPEASAGSTATTRVKTAFPTPRLAIEQLMAPVPPTAGAVHDQPPGDESDMNVVPAGTVSVRVTVAALLGPAFVSVMV